jgi:hypothetical protein
VNEAKKDLRDAEDDVKEAWRKADGEESLGDKAANAGDRIRHGVENATDDIHKDVDDASRRVAYERGRVDEINRKDDPGAS